MTTPVTLPFPLGQACLHPKNQHGWGTTDDHVLCGGQCYMRHLYGRPFAVGLCMHTSIMHAFGIDSGKGLLHYSLIPEEMEEYTRPTAYYPHFYM